MLFAEPRQMCVKLDRTRQTRTEGGEAGQNQTSQEGSRIEGLLNSPSPSGCYFDQNTKQTLLNNDKKPNVAHAVVYNRAWSA